MSMFGLKECWCLLGLLLTGSCWNLNLIVLAVNSFAVLKSEDSSWSDVGQSIWS